MREQVNVWGVLVIILLQLCLLAKAAPSKTDTLTLTGWTESHIATVLNARSNTDLDIALGKFLSKNASLVVNGVEVSHSSFAQTLAGKTMNAGATVTFAGSVEFPTEQGSSKAGNVGVFYHATLEVGAPLNHMITASFNVVIEQDPSIQPPHPGLPNVNFDPRRVKALNEVTLLTPVAPPPST